MAKPHGFNPTAKQLQRMKALVEAQTHTYQQIGERFEVSDSTVLRLAKKHNWKGATKSHLTKAKQTAKLLLEAGKSLAVVGKKLTVPEATLRAWCVQGKWEVELRRYNVELTRAEVKKIVAQYAKGSGCSELGRDFNRSPTSITKILRAEGVKIRSVSATLMLKNDVKKRQLHRSRDMTFKQYGYECRLLTNRTWLKYRRRLDPKRRRGQTSYHLDHKLSIYDGYYRYKDIVPPKAMSHVANLRMLPHSENHRKYSSSSISRRQLLLQVKGNPAAFSRFGI